MTCITLTIVSDAIPIVSNPTGIVSDNRLNLTWYQNIAGNIVATFTDATGYPHIVLQGVGHAGANSGQTGILTILTVGIHTLCINGVA